MLLLFGRRASWRRRLLLPFVGDRVKLVAGTVATLSVGVSYLHVATRFEAKAGDHVTIERLLPEGIAAQVVSTDLSRADKDHRFIVRLDKLAAVAFHEPAKKAKKTTVEPPVEVNTAQEPYLVVYGSESEEEAAQFEPSFIPAGKPWEKTLGGIR